MRATTQDVELRVVRRRRGLLSEPLRGRQAMDDDAWIARGLPPGSDFKAYGTRVENPHRLAGVEGPVLVGHTRLEPAPEGRRSYGVELPLDLDHLKYPLYALHMVTWTVEQLEEQRAALVQQCRRDGRSWAQIAEALGVTRQSAWERYSSPDE